MARGLSVTLTHTGLVNTSLLLSDVYPTTDGHTAYRRAGPVYVPVSGVVELTYSDTVALSLESGSIRGFVDLGYLTAVLSFGSSVTFPPATGDVSGSYPNLTVVGLQGNAVDPAAPAAGEPFVWDGAKWSPTTAGGDVTGPYTALTVVGLNGVGIDLAAPANGDALLYNNLTNKWEHSPIVFGGGPPVGPAGGDLGGLYPNPSVAGIQGQGLAGINVADGFLKRNAANLAWEEVAYGSVANTVCEGDDARLSDARTPTGAAGGDLSGNYPNPVVDGLQNRPVSNAAPAVGAALVWDGVQWAPATGGLTGSYTMVAVVANHNAAPWEIILADTTAGGFTVTLPLAATCAGKPITIKKVSGDGNVLLVDAQGAEQIDGSPSLSITGQYVSPTVVSDGTDWWVI